MVEFALVAPLFMVLFVGLADMGRGLLAYTELSMGSRAAARQAVLQYNAGSNTGSSGCSSPCQAPGVVPIIKQVAGWGFPITYSDSAGTTTPPTYATATADTGWVGGDGGAAPPYDVSLASSGVSNNTIYVIEYEFDPSSTTRAARWPISGSARDAGHQMVLVDLRVKWTSITLSLLGLTPTLTLDSQTVQRLEY